MNTPRTDVNLLGTTDASVWAREFMCVVNSGAVVDEGLMLAWFSGMWAATNDLLQAELTAAKAENDGLRKALEFYANLNNWIEVTNYLDGDIESTEPSAAERDLGQIARDALERM